VRSGEPTFLSVTLPGIDYSDEVSARANGQLVIHMGYMVGSNVALKEEIARAELEAINIYEGGSSKSIVLSGHKTVSWGNPKTVTLSGVIYRSVLNGETTLRTPIPNLYLRPGDTVTYDSVSITVDQISISIGPAYSLMDVRGQ